MMLRSSQYLLVADNRSVAVVVVAVVAVVVVAAVVVAVA